MDGRGSSRGAQQPVLRHVTGGTADVGSAPSSLQLRDVGVPDARVDGPAVVVSRSLATAEAYVSALDLKPALPLLLPGAFLNRSPRAVLHEEPSAVLVVDSDIGTVVSEVRAIKRRWRTVPVMVAGAPDREQAILRCFAAGADGLVLPHESLDELVRAFGEVRAGRFRAPPNMQRFFGHLVNAGGATTHFNGTFALTTLSPRQLEILALLTDGKTNKDIARELHLEIQTVKNHVSRLLRRIDAHSRYDAARLGVARRSAR